MNFKTLLPLVLLALTFTISQAHAESDGAPLRLVWKLFNLVIADTRMLLRASQQGLALQAPDPTVAIRLLFTW